MANHAYNKGSSCRADHLEEDVPFESTKSTGIYDQIHDWNNDKFTWNCSSTCTVHIHTNVSKVSIHTHNKLFWTNNLCMFYSKTTEHSTPCTHWDVTVIFAAMDIATIINHSMCGNCTTYSIYIHVKVYIYGMYTIHVCIHGTSYAYISWLKDGLFVCNRRTKSFGACFATRVSGAVLDECLSTIMDKNEWSYIYFFNFCL